MDTADALTAPRPLLVVGELCVDLIVLLDPASGDIRFGQHEQLVTSTTLTMGSSSAITACGAARLGVPTSLVAVRGDDVFGLYLAEQLRLRGVDASVGRVDATVPTGSSTHLSRPGGDRAILTAMGSIGAVTAADVSNHLLDAHAHLHVGSYFLQEQLWADAPALFERARARGLTTSLDGNFDPTQQWDRGILSALAHVDVFFGNEEEACGITGLGDAASAVDALLDAMPVGAQVVYKRGAEGALVAWRDGGETRRLTAAPPVSGAPLVDTVGAGDSLAAGYLAARLSGADTAAALSIAVSCGTASTRSAGGVDAQADAAEALALAATVTVR